MSTSVTIEDLGGTIQARVHLWSVTGIAWDSSGLQIITGGALLSLSGLTLSTAAQGQPKYYAMFGGATGNTDTTSGRIFVAPTPNTTYRFRVHFNKMPDTLESGKLVTLEF